MNTRARHQLTYAVWGLAAVGAATLWSRNTPERGAIPAVVEAGRHTLGAVAAGRVAAIFARPGQAVRAGDPVVQLDTAPVDAELAVAQRIYDEILAELDAVTASLEEEQRAQRQSLGAELARARAALVAVRSEEAARKAELSSLKEQLGRLDSVLQDRLAEADRMGGLRAREEMLTEVNRHAPEVARVWTGLTQELSRTLGALTDTAMARRVAPLRARLDTQTALLSNLVEGRARLTLRAPVDAQVTQLLHGTGDPVAAGEPVAVLVATRAARLVAYAPEETARSFTPGRAVTATPRQRGFAVGGTIASVGSEVVELPPHLWLTPDRPRYGRPVYIELHPAGDGELLAGEAVTVAMRSGAGGAEAAVPRADGPPVVPVPDSLRGRTRLEGSGLLWMPEWERFVVVSDDTGPAGADPAPPWVFTLDPARGFDPEPIALEGLETVSDLESVTRASDGTLYLLASQSLSQKGRRPEKRQLLLHAEAVPGARRLRVLERVALHDALASKLDADGRLAVGFGPTLDIEGMTWSQGDLLLGLKSPHDTAGRARLLKLHVGAGAASLSTLEVEPFRALPLPTCATGAPGGFSDLMADGDTLYFTSTLPDGPPCGSAWRLDLRSADAAPVKLEDYESYKPEGIARDAHGRLTVLFDAGAAPPRLAVLNESKP